MRRRSHFFDQARGNYRRIGVATIQAALIGVLTCGCGRSPTPAVAASASNSSTTSAGSGSGSASITPQQQRALADAHTHILNFATVDPDPSAGSAPIILRGGRLGIDRSDPHKDGLSANIQTLHDLGVKTLINLQGGDIHAKVQIKNGEGKSESRLSELVNGAIDAVNRKLEPGEAKEYWQKEGDAATALGITFKHHALSSLEPIDSAEENDIRTILKIMHDPARQPVYLHCEHGHDRTGMIIALYRACFDNVDRQTAYDDMKAKGHNPNDHVTQSTDIFFWRSMANGFCDTVRK